MDFVYKYSGLFSILTTLLLVILPSLKSGLDQKHFTISQAYKNKSIGIIISLGLIIGTVFQVFFLQYLNFKLNPHFIFNLLYLSTNLATIGVALISEKQNYRLHELLVHYYFLLHPLSLFGITFQSNFQLSSLLFLILYYLGLLLIIKKYGQNAILEIWCFTILALWVILLTFA